MNKKKVVTTATALGLTVTLLGGTLAWFSSYDDVTNKFTAAGLLDPNDDKDKGVEIWEEFDGSKTQNVLPGTTNTKLVQIQNTSTYDQFIRVALTPKWVDKNGNNISGTGENDLKLDMIELIFGENKSNLGKDDGKWLKGDDGYYYYMGKVGSELYTNALLSEVKLSEKADNKYKNAKFEVLVYAESIQAANQAFTEWKTAGDEVLTKLSGYEKLDAVGNEDTLNENVTITNTNSRPDSTTR